MPSRIGSNVGRRIRSALNRPTARRGEDTTALLARDNMPDGYELALISQSPVPVRLGSVLNIIFKIKSYPAGYAAPVFDSSMNIRVNRTDENYVPVPGPANMVAEISYYSVPTSNRVLAAGEYIVVSIIPTVLPTFQLNVDVVYGPHSGIHRVSGCVREFFLDRNTRNSAADNRDYATLMAIRNYAPIRYEALYF
ncbi:hypothetical protein GGR50DRAFT_604285 [Xylaria sp. CBS 124048]|nr:hypothetical protein GGR50DRAFT_604285 [Xylaria sp. CBS 124048]